MGAYLFPMLVFTFFAGLFAVQSSLTTSPLPAPTVAQASSDGKQFVAYRDAVAAYLRTNPTFIGSVPSATLIARGNQFSSSFLGSAGNYVSQVGAGTGRVITAYASLAPGSVSSALAITSGDMSLGMASGNKWISYAQGAVMTPQTLSTAVPDGYVVSVVQIGN